MQVRPSTKSLDCLFRRWKTIILRHQQTDEKKHVLVLLLEAADGVLSFAFISWVPTVDGLLRVSGGGKRYLRVK